MVPRLASVAVLLVLACGPFAPALLAHGDLHAQIAALSKRIKADPRNARLYVERGGLYRAHRQLRLALSDCDRALRLAPRANDARLCRGLTLAAAGRHHDAEIQLNAIITRQPDLVAARIARARVLIALGRPVEADLDYAAALTAQPNPDWYLERAHGLSRAQAAQAIAVLDEAIEKLGPLVTLQDYAVDLDVRAGRFASALSRIDVVLGQLSYSPVWLVRRAELLEESKRVADAHRGYVEVVAHIEAMPATRRRTRAIHELLLRARAGQTRTASTTSSPTPVSGR